MAIWYSSHSLSRLSKLSGSGSALNIFTPSALPNSKTLRLASVFFEKCCTPQANGVT